MVPMTNRTRPSNATADTPYLRAMGMAAARPTAVPMRAPASCSPMAVAISLPLNHLTMTFDTVMPATSTPMPKKENPMAATHTCVRTGKPETSPIQHMATPKTITREARMPVKRTPFLSRMMPPMMSMNANTLSQP
jgi:hypothetical protein